MAPGTIQSWTRSDLPFLRALRVALTAAASFGLSRPGERASFLSLLAVRVARDERQEIVQRHGEITPGAALCIAVECAAVISEPGLFDR